MADLEKAGLGRQDRDVGESGPLLLQRWGVLLMKEGVRYHFLGD